MMMMMQTKYNKRSNGRFSHDNYNNHNDVDDDDDDDDDYNDEYNPYATTTRPPSTTLTAARPQNNSNNNGVIANLGDIEMEPLTSRKPRGKIHYYANRRKPTKKINKNPKFFPLCNPLMCCFQLPPQLLTVFLLISIMVNSVLIYRTKSLSKNNNNADLLNNAGSKYKKSPTNYPICHLLLKYYTTSPLELWNQHMAQIHEASRLPNDVGYETLHDFTAELLALITPRLVYSTKTLTRQWSLVADILQKGLDRYQFLQQNKKVLLSGGRYPSFMDSNTIPEPVRITVMGGSVTGGKGCYTGIKYHDQAMCAWPFRLQNFINSFLLDPELIQLQHSLVIVNNVAVSGTNSKIGTAVLRYNVLSEETSQADVLINAYAANDDHYYSDRDQVFNTIQAFIRQAKTPKCPNDPIPLVIHIDDAIGSDQDLILQKSFISNAIHLLSNYYGIASINYIDAVRDYIYGDTFETWLSPDQFYLGQEKYKQNGHPGHGMHLVMSWMVVFHFIQTTTSFCSLEEWRIVEQFESQQQHDNNITYNPHSSLQMPKIWNASDETLLGKPELPPHGLPPRLTWSSTINTTHYTWRQEEEQQQDYLSKTKSNNNNNNIIPDYCPRFNPKNNTAIHHYQRCPISWLSNHGHVGKVWFEQHILDKVVEQSRWEFDAPHMEHIGLLPPKTNPLGSFMTLEFQNMTQPIRTVVLFILRNENWKLSTTMVEIFQLTSNVVDGITWKTLRQDDDIRGYHSEPSPEMYTEEFELKPNEVPIGGTMRVKMTLTKGEKFKWMGLALCS